MQVDNGTVVSHRRTRNGRRETWDCRWQVAFGKGDDGFGAEFFVPFAGGQRPPVPGGRWRLNCRVTDGTDASERAVAQWGSEETERTEHGVILVFGLQ